MYDRATVLAKVGAWECDLATEQLTWSDAVYDLFELERGSRVDRKAILHLYDEQARHEMERLREHAIRTGEGFTLDAAIRTSRGGQRWMRLTTRTLSQDGRPHLIYGAKQDVTAERQAWARLRRLADRDPLTGLPNRGVFDDVYQDVVNERPRSASVSALALVDLDDFKGINDTYGHAAGDACLQHAAERLAAVCRAAPLVARLGGDEFAVLLPATPDRLALAQLLQELMERLNEPFSWGGDLIGTSVSIGVSVLGRSTRRSRWDLFGEADAALYAAKRAGRSTIRFFSTPGRATGADPIFPRRPLLAAGRAA